MRRYNIKADVVPGNDTWAEDARIKIEEVDNGEWVRYEDAITAHDPSSTASELDLILLISHLKPIIYGIPGSEAYPGLQHQSCGVDSFSVSDHARENMSIAGFVESDPTSDLGELISDDLAKDIVFFITLTASLADISPKKSVAEIISELRETSFID
jgi:hypothetical protein